MLILRLMRDEKNLEIFKEMAKDRRLLCSYDVWCNDEGVFYVAVLQCLSNERDFVYEMILEDGSLTDEIGELDEVDEIMAKKKVELKVMIEDLMKSLHVLSYATGYFYEMNGGD